MLRKKGFTLLELIIVIIVIGILASIALPRFMRVTEKARTAEAKTALSAIRSAQIRYKAQYGTYAGDINATDMTVDEKYYTYTAIAAATDGDLVANATRTGVEFALDSAYAGYSISITGTGVLNISNSDLEYLL